MIVPFHCLLLERGSAMKKTILLLLSVLITFATNSQTVPTQGLVLYYPFNGNAFDSSGNGHDGIPAGATLTADRFGESNRAYSFNGINSIIRCGDILDSIFSAIPVAKFSVSGWANTRSYKTLTEDGGYMFGKNAGGSGPYQWGLGHYQGLVLASAFSDTNGLSNYIGVVNPMTTNQWFHYVYIFDGSQPETQRVKLYINGLATNTSLFWHFGTMGTTTVNTNQQFCIGATFSPKNPNALSNFYDGILDDIRIYSRVLADSEIQVLYHERGWPLISLKDPVLYYPLNGNAHDSSGNGYNATASGVIPRSDRFGVLNSAYSFNGSSSIVRCGDILDNVFSAPVAKFSVSGWAMTRTMGSVSGGSGFILGKNGGGNLGPYQWNVTHADGVVYGVVSSDTLAQNYVALACPMTTNQWFHFVLVFDGSQPEMQRVKLFVNGKSANSALFQHVGSLGTMTCNSQQPLTIGATYHANSPEFLSNFYDGNIDDIRIYGRVLDETEVLALYHAGGWPKLVSSDLAAYYPFDGNAVDSSDNRNDGIVAGATLTTDRFGAVNKAYSFNGINSTIRCGDVLDNVFSAPVAKFSVSGWANTRTCGTLASGGGFIVGKDAGGTFGPYQWGISHVAGLVVASAYGDTANHRYVLLACPMAVNQWFHFVLLFDGSLPEAQRLKLYVNGQTSGDYVYAQDGELGTNTPNSQQQLTIGAGHSGGHPLTPVNCYDGSIDDIRIYNRVLSESEIQAMYYAGGWPGAATLDVPHILFIKDVPNDNGKQVLISWKVPRPAAFNGISHFSIRYWDKGNLVWVSEPGDIDAYPDTIHSAVAATMYDSTKTKGIYYSVFQVAAHGMTPDQITISPSDSGYSVDNVSPLAPTSPSRRPGQGNSWIISWKAPKDQVADFKEYVVYRSAVPSFLPDASLRLGEVEDTVFIDNTVPIGTTFYYGITSIDSSGNESRCVAATTTGINGIHQLDGVPADFDLASNFPNPFNPSTTIRFGVPVSSRVKIEIFNILGQRITEIVNEDFSPGYYEREWYAGFASGLYLCRIDAVSLSDPGKRFVATRKMLMVK